MTPQTTLKGGRTSAVVPKGTSPAAAAAAARASQTNEKAPSAVGGKGKGGAPKGEPGKDLDYELEGFGGGDAGGDDGGGPRVIAGFGVLLPGEDEAEAMEGGPLERRDGKHQDKNGRWRDAKGHFTTPPGPEPTEDPAMAAAQAQVLQKYTPTTIEAEFDAQGRAKFPKGDGSLIDKFRAVFREDKRPDTPHDDVTRREQSARDDYMADSQKVAEGIRMGGRIRDSSGRFAKSVTVTTHGAVQIRGADGRVRETLRAPYREGASGRITRNIEPPITRDHSRLRAAVDDRLEKYGSSLFQDRAGLSPRRLAAMRIAFVLDRKERGWPVPDWGLDL